MCAFQIKSDQTLLFIREMPTGMISPSTQWFEYGLLKNDQADINETL